MKMLAVVGARPNFMKIAPILWEAHKRRDVAAVLVHTGQHYDERMSRLFFRDLNIPAPDVDLEVGSGSHAVQTAEVMKRFEPRLLEHKPDLVLVVGDVNSALACALVAAKLGVPVAHVEAGLRSFDRSMPEEINRVLTDAISDWLFVSESSGVENLLREGVAAEKIHLVGNVMIDTLLACRAQAETSSILTQLGVGAQQYAVLTLHRPANVDDPRTMSELLRAIEAVQQEIPVVFPVHPRTRRSLERHDLSGLRQLHLTEPLGYLDFLKLLANARLVLTDSGGIQEESTILGVPCLTLRNNTERPVTLDHGSNRLVGLDPDRIIATARWVLSSSARAHVIPPYWDGQAARRILDVLTH